jgi:hypothetical protein
MNYKLAPRGILPCNAEQILHHTKSNGIMLTINQTAESKDLFGAELGEKLLDGFLGDAIVLDFITDKFFLRAGLLE